MEKENDKKILSEEELKEVAGGGRSAPTAYCEAHLTLESCHATGCCRWWYSGRRWDNISQQWVDGYCGSK